MKRIRDKVAGLDVHRDTLVAYTRGRRPARASRTGRQIRNAATGRSDRGGGSEPSHDHRVPDPMKPLVTTSCLCTA